MLHADLALARRHERAAAAIESEYARSLAAMRPGSDVAAVRIADGVAVFAGVGSPMSQATGLGLDGPITDADLEALEAVYHSRGAGARVVVCPLVDDTLIAVLTRRGYGLVEFEQVMIRSLVDEGRSANAPGIEVAEVGSTEADRYMAAVGPNFTEDGIVAPALRDMMLAAMQMTCARSLLARCDGNDAGGGSLLIHGGLAMLAGASTLPRFRNRGVQTGAPRRQVETRPRGRLRPGRDGRETRQRVAAKRRAQGVSRRLHESGRRPRARLMIREIRWESRDGSATIAAYPHQTRHPRR